MDRVNPRFLAVKESATLAINQRARALRQAGHLVCHLGFGESPFPVPPPMVEALKAHAGEKAYLPGEGLPELREAAAAFLRRQGHELHAANILVGPGSKELLFDLLAILAGPVLVPVPAWVSYAPQAALLGKLFVPLETSRERGYRLAPETLAQACRAHPGPKTLILNSPGNPTGTVYSPEDLEGLAEVCEREGVVVLSDEIYGLVTFVGGPAPSMATVLPSQTIITTGLSKAFAAGGWRLGLAALPDALGALMPPLRAMISETFSAVSAPIQYGALPAFAYGPEIAAFVETTTAIHGAAGAFLYERFQALGLFCPRPEGAFYLFPDFKPYRETLAARGITTGAALAEALLNDAGVATLPGADFGMAPESLTLRIASVDYDGAEVLARFSEGAASEDLFPRLKAGADAIETFLGACTA
jgi:aspartate aminotransferase